MTEIQKRCKPFQRDLISISQPLIFNPCVRWREAVRTRAEKYLNVENSGEGGQGGPSENISKA